MPSYKLTYFNVKARAEVSRFLFHIAEVEYEDDRIEREQWPALKSKMPFGQLPVLEVDGKTLCQSRVIEAFLARRFGLAGKTDWDQARAAMINDCLEDLRNLYKIIYFEKDEAKKAKLKKTFEEGSLITHLNNFDKILKENNGSDGYFVGDGMTYADVAFFHHTNAIPIFAGTEVDWDKWPTLKALREKVETHPRVADWIASRPTVNDPR